MVKPKPDVLIWLPCLKSSYRREAIKLINNIKYLEEEICKVWLWACDVHGKGSVSSKGTPPQ